MILGIDNLYFGFILMIIASIVISSFIKRKTSNLSRYFYGDRKLKSGSVAQLFLSTAFSMNGILYQVWLGYRIGWWALLIQGIWCLCYFWMAKYTKRIKNLSEGGSTLHGIIAQHFDVRTAKLAAIVTILSLSLQTSWELIVGVSIFSSNTAIQTIFIVVISVITAGYTAMGGLRGNLRANIFQNVVAMISFTSIFFILYLMYNSTSNSTSDTPNIALEMGGVGAIVSNIVLSLFFQFGDMSAWQNLAAADKNDKTRKRALYKGSIWVFLFPGVIGTVIGLCFKDTTLASFSGVGAVTADNLFLHILNLIEHISPFWIILISAGFAGAMLSTIDGLLLTSGLAIVADISKKHHEPVQKIMDMEAKEAQIPEDLKTKEIAAVDTSRKWIVVLATTCPLIIFLITKTTGLSIFDLVYIAFLVPMVLIPIVFKILLDKENTKMKLGWQSISCGLVAGFICVVIGLFFKTITILGSNLLVWSTTVSLLVSFLFYFSFKSKNYAK